MSKLPKVNNEPVGAGFFHKLREIFTNLRIRSKLFLINVIIILIVCCTSLIAIQVTLGIYQRILYSEVAKVLNFSTINIENELKQIERLTLNIVTNPEIQLSLEKLKTKLTNYRQAQEGNKLTESLWSILLERNIISVNIVDAHGNQYAGGALIPEATIAQITVRASKKEGSMILIEPLKGDSYIVCARLIRKIRNLSLEPLGTLIIRVNTANLIQQCIAGSVNRDVNLLILSGARVVYASTPFLKKLVTIYKSTRDTGYIVNKLGNDSYFIAHDKSSFSQWTYISALPYGTVFKQIVWMRNLMMLVFILLFFFTIILSMKSANSLTKPIEKLTIKMKRVESGDFSIKEEYSLRTDEIGDLERDFVIMIQKIDTLIKDNYTRQILIKDVQLKALQAQINPHFLYNTLESINWLAKTNNQKDISLMVESLGSLLRNAISDEEQCVTLKEEIGLLDAYITIQKIRFGERLDFSLDIDKQWQRLLIPKLILQPIVENSINYGLEKMLGVCRITVSSTESDDCLCIIVQDNGPGISLNTLEKLKRWELKPRGLGIGLKNINERLILTFGEQYGIAISSGQGKGTRVVLRIPKTGDGHV